MTPLRGVTRSVRARILLAIVVVAALGLLVAGGSTYLVLRDRVFGEVDDRLQSEVATFRSFATGSADGATPGSVRSLLTSALQRIVPQPDESTLGVIDGQPSLVPATELPFRIDSDRALLRRILSETRGGTVVSGTADSRGRSLRYVAVPVRAPGDTSDGVYIAAVDTNPALGRLGQSFQIFTLIGTGSVVLLGVVGWFLAGRLLRPLRLLKATAAQATERDLSRRVPVDGQDDVSDLARTVNAMLDRMERAFVAQHRLLDDVGHELRTPLTIVRGHLELVDPHSPADVEATRALALDELDRMAALVEDLSLLARSEEPTFLTVEPVSLRELTASVLAKAQALSPDHEWVAADAADARITADPRRLTEAWLQLAENAAKYAPADTRISVGSRVTADPRRVELWVQDEGPGVPSAARDRVFERFARTGDGRGMSGAGLGLSIVRAIAVAHGGSARLEDGSEGGTRALIVVPREGAADVAHPRR